MLCTALGCLTSFLLSEIGQSVRAAGNTPKPVLPVQEQVSQGCREPIQSGYACVRHMHASAVGLQAQASRRSQQTLL
eukprot:358216-Chlamydomonas_euryale.AAC.4